MVNLLDVVKWGVIVLAIAALVAGVAAAAGTVSGLASNTRAAVSDEYGVSGVSDLSLTQDVVGSTLYYAAATVVGDGAGGLLAALGGLFATIAALGLTLLVYRFLRQVFA